MPIRADLRHHYLTPAWRTVSRFVKFERAKGHCENCGRAHGQKIYYLPDGRVGENGNWAFPDGSRAPFPTLLDLHQASVSTVWLQTAHLNHNPEDSSPENLAAWCGRCHLEYDKNKHLRSRIENRRRRYLDERVHNAIRDLFATK